MAAHILYCDKTL